MNPPGCKSDESNRCFLSLKFGTSACFHQFASAVALGFGAESASALIKALEKQASVEV
jgi:hypothetical protein